MKKELGIFQRTAREVFKKDWIMALWVFTLFLGVRVVYIIPVVYQDRDLSYIRVILEHGRNLFVLWLLVFIILKFIMPPDFKYKIIVDAGYIVFAFPNETKKIISQSFEISKKKMYSLVLKDKEDQTTIEIPYNRKVLKLLKEIQN